MNPRILGPAALVAAGFVALIAGLSYGGGASAQALEDPGALVRWGLPAATLLVNIAASGMIGALVLACWALSPSEPEYDRALDISAASAAVFTVASAATGFFTFLSVTNTTVSLDDRFGATLSQFLTQIPLGQSWLATTLIGALVTVLAFAVRNQTTAVFVTIAAVASLVPMAQQGHAAGTAGAQRGDRRPRHPPRLRCRLAGRAHHDHPAQAAVAHRTARGRARPVLHGGDHRLHLRRGIRVRERSAAGRHLGATCSAPTACS